MTRILTGLTVAVAVAVLNLPTGAAADPPA